MNEELLTLIQRNSGIATLLQFFATNCPNHPTSYTMNEVDIVKSNFGRYSLRTMYFAETLFNNLNQTLAELKTREFSRSTFGTTIKDSVFFDLDAFVISAAVITTGNINGKLKKHLHETVKIEFATYIDRMLISFVKPYLNEIRNEIMHINNFGTSIGSMSHVQMGKAFIITNHEVEPDMVVLFTKVLHGISDIIFNVSRFIMIHDCELFGYPEKDITFNNGKSSIKLSEFVPIASNKYL